MKQSHAVAHANDSLSAEVEQLRAQLQERDEQVQGLVAHIYDLRQQLDLASDAGPSLTQSLNETDLRRLRRVCTAH